MIIVEIEEEALIELKERLDRQAAIIREYQQAQDALLNLVPMIDGNHYDLEASVPAEEVAKLFNKPFRGQG